MYPRTFSFLDELSVHLDAKDTDKVLEYLTEDCLLQAGNSDVVIGKENIR